MTVMLHLHGPVPVDDDIYAPREFEVELARNVQAGRWILFLGPRQHGKTSAFYRLQKGLTENSMSVVLVDLQRTPPFKDYAALVGWFARTVAKGLKHEVTIQDTDDLAAALEDALPNGNSPVIVLVDEASSVSNDEWRNSFFGQLRAISSERASAPDGHIAKRLRFVFAGTFRPETLVAEANSPFNICERIDTTDLSCDDVIELSSVAGAQDPKGSGTSIFDFVGGQPFLVQKLLDSILDAEDEAAALQNAIERLAEGDSEHLGNLFRRVLADENLRAIVTRVIADGSIPVEAGDDDQKYLVVLGLLKREKGKLLFRNKLYAEIASNSPQLTELGTVEAPKAVIFALPKDAFNKLKSKELKEIAFTAQIGAVGAYKSGSNRLALAGLGTAMEAALIDFLSQLVTADLAKAAAQCKNKGPFFKGNDPSTWTLVDLMRGARKLLNKGDLDIPENLREWRNLIHPGACLRSYKEDHVLAPEVCTAAGQLQIVLRDLP